MICIFSIYYVKGHGKLLFYVVQFVWCTVELCLKTLQTHIYTPLQSGVSLPLYPELSDDSI